MSLLCFPVGNCIIGYDCGGELTEKLTLSLVDVPICKEEEKNITNEDSYVQLIQPKKFQSVFKNIRSMSYN